MKIPANERVLRRTSYDHGCWVFGGAKDKNGYGRVTRKGEIGTTLAHRVVYEALIGPLPQDLVLDHLCRNPSCVNPWHLDPVSFRTNIERGKSRAQATCPHGHPYDEENTRYDRANKKRICKVCARGWQAKKNAKRRAAVL